MKRISSLLFACFFPLLLAPFAFAQAPTASISGQVKDPTGAILAGAHVRATNVDTGVPYSTVSNGDGRYSLPLLPIGSYSLLIEAPGFQSIERRGLILAVDQRAEINVSLPVGHVGEVVTVNANSAQLETASHSLGTVVGTQKIEQLPLNTRVFYTLALLVPGVLPPANNSSLGYRGGFDIGGAPESFNNFTLDGIDANNEQLNDPGFRPSIDGIAEFKVFVGMYGAEYGRDAGGQVIVVGKSGTNTFHGLAYEYARNQVFDAKNYTTPVGYEPSFARHQFGGTFGGPIVRNKTFFFFNYEGLNLQQTLSILTTVPLPAMLSGDFSSLLPATKLKDPFTGALVPGNNLTNLSQWTTKASTVGRALAAYYPQPATATLAGSGPSNNYTFNAVRPETSNQFGLRIDHTLSAKDSMYGEYNFSNDSSFEPSNVLCQSRTIPGFGCYAGLTYMLAGLSETHIFTPSIVNTFRLGYNRFEQSRKQQDGSINFAGTYGFPNYVFSPASLEKSNYGLPATIVKGYAAVGGPVNNPQDFVNDEYEWADQLLWTKGGHSMNIGVDIRRNQANSVDVVRGRGQFTFIASPNAPTTGYALADLLLGLPTETLIDPFGPKLYTRTSAFDGWIQDDWKVDPRLTLNLGARYEVNTPFTSRANQQSTFNLVTGQVQQAGTGGLGPNLIQYDYSKIQPRVGFSYMVSDKTVVRGGYGIYVSVTPTLSGLGTLFFNLPMRNPQTYISSKASCAPTDGAIQPAQCIQLSNPFPTGTTAPPGSATPSGIDYNYLNPYIQQYGLGVQRQLTANTLLDVSYFGSKGAHLPDTLNINQPPAQSAITSTAGIIALSPYPAFGLIAWFESKGYSNYNSLLAKLDKRYSNGLNLLVSYSYAKSLDDTPGFNGSNASTGTPQDSYNLLNEYGPSDFDNRQALVVSGIYQLPFGRGETWLKNGVASALAGGWQLSGISSYLSSRPFTIYFAGNVSNTLNLNDRPNIVGDVNAGPRTATEWFNNAAVATATAPNTSGIPVTPFGTFGDERRNSIQGPNYVDVDLALARNFTVHNEYNMQFIAQTFNVLNHPNFNLPGSTIGNGGYNTITSVGDPREFQLALRISF